MEGGGRQSRLLGRLLGKLRGDHRPFTLDNHSSMSMSFTRNSDTTICESHPIQEEATDEPMMNVLLSGNPPLPPKPPPPLLGNMSPPATPSLNHLDDEQFAVNIDLRYGGQYLTPEQLPEFCNQLHNLVQVIRNIQSYAKVTGEYPRNLEQRLQREAEEVAALAAEARNARDVVTRTHVQRRALRAQRKQLAAHLATLRETVYRSMLAEVRELENNVRLSDRKLFKSWEALKNAVDPAEFDQLLAEIKNKQSALEGLVRLIDNRRATVTKNANQANITPHPLPPPLPVTNANTEESTTASASKEHRRDDQRSNAKRRRKDGPREPRSVPLSVEPSHHGAHPQQVSLLIQGSGNQPQFRVGSAGAVHNPLELPSRDSVRDIVIFTSF